MTMLTVRDSDFARLSNERRLRWLAGAAAMTKSFSQIRDVWAQHTNGPEIRWAFAKAAKKRKGAWPGVVDDPWNARRRTNLHNAKNNRRSIRIWPIYGVPK